MDPKKKIVFKNLCLKPKSPLKKPDKKAKQGKRLMAHRRSSSVPDLRLVPSGPIPTESTFSTTSDAVFFGNSSGGQSDTDSTASGLSGVSTPSFSERLTESVPESRRCRFHSDNADGFNNRMSLPRETQHHYEEVNTSMMRSVSDTKVNQTAEALYARVDKRGNVVQENIQTPVPAPRYLSNIPLQNELYTIEASPTDQGCPGVVAGAMPRVNSFGDQVNVEKRPSFETRRRAFRVNTPADKWSVDRRSVDRRSVDSGPVDRGPVDSSGAPAESAEDSACGTPVEERVNLPWTTDSEDLDREAEIMSAAIFAMEDPQLEEGQEEMEISSEQNDLFDDAMQDLLESSATAAPGVSVPAALQRYLLNITLKEGRGLVIRNKRSGTSHPYVKFKLEGKQLYKSKVVYKSLNPLWNESFSHPLRDREHAVEVRVYDKNRTSDLFMGSGTIDLKHVELYKTCEMELHLEDPKSKEDDMGVIVVDICLMFRDATVKRSPRWAPKKNKQNQNQNQVQPTVPRSWAEVQKSQLRNQVWSGVYAITLVEGQDLPQHGIGDVYVRFRLGEQRYKSKNLCIQANPQWREHFEFNQFEDKQALLQVEVFSKRGRKSDESWGMFEIDISRIQVNETQLCTHMLDPGKGRLVLLVSLAACCGVSITDLNTAPLEQPDERDATVEKFHLKNSHKSMKEVGFLQVKVLKATDVAAADLSGKSDPFCVVELGNSRLQTPTIFKTLNPEWNKVFTFPIKDIHDVVEFTVLDANTNNVPIFLGKVAIPLLSVENGQQVCQLLKKEDLGRGSKGTITLVLDVIYNKVRAGVRSFQPKETKFTEENVKFHKKVLAQNICRVRKITTAILYTLQYITTCFQWESTQRSLTAFLIFLVTVWHWELFMLPLFLLLLVGWNYFQLRTGRTSANQDLVNLSMADDEDEDEKDSGRKGLMDKIHMVQEVVLTVQNILDEIASVGERIKNIFNWSVPFLSCLSCLMLFVLTTVLYFVPLRYIVLIWGVNKFTKKLRKPHTIDNNEILDFLQRVPTDVQKVQHSELRAPTIQNQNQPRRRR